MNGKVDYNKISPVYDTRYKQNPLTGIQTFLTKLVDQNSPINVLEVGCGTGHWLNELSSSDINLFGIDFSNGMLNAAKSNVSKTNFVNADANKLPLKDNLFDLIYVVNAIHHFPNPAGFIYDSYKKLNTSGTLCIIGMELWDSINNWYMYDYFKRTLEIDLKRIPSFSNIDKVMNDAGFKNITKTLAEEVNSSKKGRDVLKDHFIDRKGASQLALLTDEEYNNGIEKIKSDIRKAEQENRELIFKTKINFYAITGTKS